MNYVIAGFGTLIFIAGIVLLLKPDTIPRLIRTHSRSISLYVFAIVIRLVLGIALITYADVSKYPIVLQIIGWISLLAALGLAIVGWTRFTRLISWILDFITPYERAGSILAILFGSFLVYAVI